MPSISCTSYISRKERFSLNAQATCNHKQKFINDVMTQRGGVCYAQMVVKVERSFQEWLRHCHKKRIVGDKELIQIFSACSRGISRFALYNEGVCKQWLQHNVIKQTPMMKERESKGNYKISFLLTRKEKLIKRYSSTYLLSSILNCKLGSSATPTCELQMFIMLKPADVYVFVLYLCNTRYIFTVCMRCLHIQV